LIQVLGELQRESIVVRSIAKGRLHHEVADEGVVGLEHAEIKSLLMRESEGEFLFGVFAF